MTSVKISVIIPVLNEQAGIVGALQRLAPMRARKSEIIVVDGGSTDDTVVLALGHADRVMTAPQGRGSQMNAGARVAQGDILLFLHADTTLPVNADHAILKALCGSLQAWGRFNVRISGKHPMLPIVATMMNLRSRLTGIATGDQAIFVRRSAFDAVGGFSEIPLMEDIAITRRLRHLAPPICMAIPVTTSGRRWEKHGVFRTIFLMWRLRFAFWLGADPFELARHYSHG